MLQHARTSGGGNYRALRPTPYAPASPLADGAAAFMQGVRRKDLATSDWPAVLGCEIPVDVLAPIEAAIRTEANSIRMRPGFRSAWAALRARGLKLAVCSNLAAPYGPPLRAALPDAPDAVALSYEIGAVKPEPAIYAAVARMLALPPARILFVGDSHTPDSDGPRRIGLQAMHVTDFERAMSRL